MQTWERYDLGTRNCIVPRAWQRTYNPSLWRAKRRGGQNPVEDCSPARTKRLQCFAHHVFYYYDVKLTSISAWLHRFGVTEFDHRFSASSWTGALVGTCNIFSPSLFENTPKQTNKQNQNHKQIKIFFPLLFLERWLFGYFFIFTHLYFFFLLCIITVSFILPRGLMSIMTTKLILNHFFDIWTVCSLSWSSSSM